MKDKIITITSLVNKSKHIKKIQMVMNTIMANACYSDKEMQDQITMAEKLGNLDDIEMDLLNKAWKTRKQLARELIDEFNIFLGGSKSGGKS